MKRYKIEHNKYGVAVYDRKLGIYIIDASTIHEESKFTVSKRGLIKRTQYKWDNSYSFRARTKIRKG